MNLKQPKLNTQQGAALVLSLIFLVLLTILGVSASTMTTLEEKMAGNTRDRIIAFQAAEAAMRFCETILNQAALPAFTNTNGYYQPAAVGATPVWNSIDWSDSDAVQTYSGGISVVGAAPACILEEIPVAANTGNESLQLGRNPTDSSTGLYRITSRGTGASPSTVVMLQSSYKR